MCNTSIYLVLICDQTTNKQGDNNYERDLLNLRGILQPLHKLKVMGNLT